MKYNPAPILELKLKDGTQVDIRPITLQDLELEKAFFNALSEQSKRERFLGAVSKLSSKALSDLCNLDYFHDMAFVAVINNGSNQKIVGVVRYAENKSRDRNAEIAVTVADDFQDQGIGTELLKRLIEFAKVAGITKLYSIDSYSNSKMKLLAKEFGFSKKTDPDDASQIIYQLDITD